MAFLTPLLATYGDYITLNVPVWVETSAVVLSMQWEENSIVMGGLFGVLQ